VIGPKARPELAEEIRRCRDEVVAILTGHACCRCGADAGPIGHLVPTYWTRWQRSLCAPCVTVKVKEFDEQDSWPPVPPELIGDRP